MILTLHATAGLILNLLPCYSYATAAIATKSIFRIFLWNKMLSSGFYKTRYICNQHGHILQDVHHLYHTLWH